MRHPIASRSCDDTAVKQAAKRAAVNPKLSKALVAGIAADVIKLLRSAVDDFKGKTPQQIKEKLQTMPIPGTLKTDDFSVKLERFTTNGDLNTLTSEVEKVVEKAVNHGKRNELEVRASMKTKRAMDKQWLIEQAVGKIVTENPEADLDKVSGMVSELTGFSVVDCVQAITLMQVDGSPSVQTAPLQNDLDEARVTPPMDTMDTPIADEMEDLGPDEFEMPASPDEVSIDEEEEDEDVPENSGKDVPENSGKDVPENSGKEVSVDEAPEENPVASLRLSSLKSGATTKEDVSRITSEPDLIQALENRKKRTTNPDIIAELDAAIAAAKKYRKDAAAKNAGASIAYDVFLGGKRIDTVFDSETDPHEVKRSLVNHDGYDSGITVRKARKPSHTPAKGVEASQKVAAYGDKRDYPKIEIFVNGVYKATTTWAKTVEEALTRYKEANPEVKGTLKGKRVPKTAALSAPIMKAAKITQKQLNNFLRSERAGLDGIGFNDHWNKEHFGLTRAEADAIGKAISEEYGLVHPSKPDLAKINKRMASVTASAAPHRKKRAEAVSVKTVEDTVESAVAFIEDNATKFEDANVAEVQTALTKAGFSREVTDKAITDLLGPDATQALGTPVKVLLEK
jgi:hypothetical protein